VRTLDELIGDRFVAGVKIDVEGAESLVLGGASRALADRRIRLLQLEWNDCSLALLGEYRTTVAEALSSFGYQLYRPTDDGGLVAVGTPGFGPDVFAMPEA